MAKLNPMLLLGGAAAVIFIASKGKKKSGCRSIQMGDMSFGDFYDRVMELEKASPGGKAFLQESWFQSNKDAFDEKYVKPAAEKFKSKLLGAVIEAAKEASATPGKSGPGSSIKGPMALFDSVLGVLIEAFNDQFPGCRVSESRLKAAFEESQKGARIQEMTPNEFLFILFAEGIGEHLE